MTISAFNQRGSMPANLNNFIEQVIKIRTIKQLSHKKLAKVLGISTQDYVNFEQGENHLAVPDLEIIAQYLGISLQVLIASEDDGDFSEINKLKDSVRPQYQSLRQKMILAKLESKRQEKDISLDELHFATEIPLEKLIAYQQDALPIPINHLIKIADALELPLEALINQQDHDPNEVEAISSDEDWQPENQEKRSDSDQEQAYQDLIEAIKSMPMDEQAQIAKKVLNVLKNQ